MMAPKMLSKKQEEKPSGDTTEEVTNDGNNEPAGRIIDYLFVALIAIAGFVIKSRFFM